jgi:hypothetical protein
MPGSKQFQDTTMKMKKINSGKLRAIGYDARARMLQVQLDNGSTLQYCGVGEDIWHRLSSSGAAWSFYRDNIEEEFTAQRVSGNGHSEAHYARSPHLNPLPQASEEANETLREFNVPAPAGKNPLDDLFGKP